MLCAVFITTTRYSRNIQQLIILGLIYKTSYDKYTTMLRHVEGLRQMYDKR